MRKKNPITQALQNLPAGQAGIRAPEDGRGAPGVLYMDGGNGGRFSSFFPEEDETISENARMEAQRAQQYYQNQYDSGSFHARHKVGAGIIDALVSGLMFGPAGFIAGPMMGAKRESKRKDAVYDDYLNQMKTLSEVEKNLNDPRIARTKGHALNQQLGTEGIASPISDYSPLDTEGYKAIGNSATAGRDLEKGLGIQRDVMSGTVGSLQDVFEQMRLENERQQWVNAHPGEPQLDPGPIALPFQVEAKKYSDPDPQPLRPAGYMNPDMTKEILGNAASIQNNMVQNFPEMVKLPGEVDKIQAEIQKEAQLAQYYLSQGKRAEAEAALTRIKTQWYPRLVQSQIARNNRPPAGGSGRAPSMLELMTPEQRSAYLNKQAGLGRGQLSPAQAELEWQLNTIINSNEDSKGRPISPAAKQAARETLSRLNGGSAAGNKAPTPSGGGTTVKVGGKAFRI